MNKYRDSILSEIKDTVKNICRAYDIHVEGVILFGSRARGDHHGESDWDILVIIGERINRDKYIRLYGDVVKGLRRFNIIADLIIVDKSYFRKMKNVVNTIPHEAVSEGISI